MPNVKEIVTDYLKANGYDGLYNADVECGCDLNDLMPCGGYTGCCKPGYKVDCEGCGEYDWCISYDGTCAGVDE